MPDAIARALSAALSGGACDLGEIRIACSGETFTLCHREDVGRADLRVLEDALAIARFDDSGKYRPLRTAPNLAHGWQLQLPTINTVQAALDSFYPGRLAALVAATSGRLPATALRETLNRQTGMYRAAARISDAQIDDVVGNFCRSDGGCLRTILWERDASGQKASSKLPREKFDIQFDQTRALTLRVMPSAAAVLPLLCQEACNLVVGECRKAVQSGRDISPKHP